MSEDTITFEFIRRVQREEQRSPKLSSIPDDFYSAVNSYVNQKRQMAKEDRKGVLEIKNIERLVEDIFDRRERKIVTAGVNAARTNIQPENMTEEERDFFDLVAATIRQRRDNSLRSILKADTAERAEMLMFKGEVPEFVGADMKSYGPFKKGDVARLPDDNAKILLQQGVVEQFRVPK